MSRLFIFLLYLVPIICFSQTNNLQEGVIDTLNFAKKLFEDDYPIEITLTSDFNKLRKEKLEGEYQPAELSYFFKDTTIRKKVKIKARGNNRRENCHFPPIALNFKLDDTDAENTPFKKLKMVVHCKTNKVYGKYILKEYLCYKLYNFFSDYSFKVRMLKVKYINTANKKTKITEMPAFLIEDQKMMAKRLNCQLEKNERLTQQRIVQQQIKELAMFQYMIGNFDWAVPTQHNIKLIRPLNSPEKIYAVPYDFDYCGFVGAGYAIPSPELGIKTVKERLYLGECKPKEEFIPVIEKFNQYKNKFYEVINQFGYLDEKEKKELIRYLDKFYKRMNLKNFYSTYILANCKTIK